ncbi:hypothetical protein ACJJTC_009315 [Scirpophaga incertulas]
MHTTSSPYLPRSNGLAESGVKIAKRILSKCKESGMDTYLALLQYRTTPRGNLASPSQLLMSRSLRTQLPSVASNLKPTVVKFNHHYKNKNRNIANSKKYYDRGTRVLGDIQQGEKVCYKKTPLSNWSPGIVKSKCEEPRSFILDTPDGFLRRNRQHLMQIPRSPTSPIVVPESQSCTASSSANTSTTHTCPSPFRTKSGRRVVRPRRLICE